MDSNPPSLEPRVGLKDLLAEKDAVIKDRQSEIARLKKRLVARTDTTELDDTSSRDSLRSDHSRVDADRDMLSIRDAELHHPPRPPSSPQAPVRRSASYMDRMLVPPPPITLTPAVRHLGDTERIYQRLEANHSFRLMVIGAGIVSGAIAILVLVTILLADAPALQKKAMDKPIPAATTDEQILKLFDGGGRSP